MVAYSGGKCIRGPQAAGLLLGEKKCCRRHGSTARRIMRSDGPSRSARKRSWGCWPRSRCGSSATTRPNGRCGRAGSNTIATSVKRVDGVTANVRQPSADLSNRTPSLQIQWDAAKLGIRRAGRRSGCCSRPSRASTWPSSGAEFGRRSFRTRCSRRREGGGRAAVRACCRTRRRRRPPPPPAGAVDQRRGRLGSEAWTSSTARSKHRGLLEQQDGGKLSGTHHGEFASGDLNGTVAANRVRFQSSLPTEGSRVSFQFDGTEQGGKMAGTVGLGEYGEAKFTAERHTYRTGGRGGRG